MRKRFTVTLDDSEIEDCKLAARLMRKNGIRGWTLYKEIQARFNEGMEDLRISGVLNEEDGDEG